MAGTDTAAAQDAGSVEAGLDALETTSAGRASLRQTLVTKVLPPLTAVVVVLAVWQGLITLRIVDEPTKLPSPGAVWQAVH